MDKVDPEAEDKILVRDAPSIKSSRICAVSSETVVSDMGDFDLVLIEVSDVELLSAGTLDHTYFDLEPFSPLWLLDNAHLSYTGDQRHVSNIRSDKHQRRTSFRGCHYIHMVLSCHI